MAYLGAGRVSVSQETLFFLISRGRKEEEININAGPAVFQDLRQVLWIQDFTGSHSYYLRFMGKQKRRLRTGSNSLLGMVSKWGLGQGLIPRLPPTWCESRHRFSVQLWQRTWEKHLCFFLTVFLFSLERMTSIIFAKQLRVFSKREAETNMNRCSNTRGISSRKFFLIEKNGNVLTGTSWEQGSGKWLSSQFW